MGREGPLPGCAMPDGPLASGPDVRPIAPGVPLLGSRGDCVADRVPDASVPAERGVPRMGRVALRTLYATHNLRWAVAVDEAIPAVLEKRCCDDVQLLCREGRRWRVRRGWLAGSRILAGTWGSRRAGHVATNPMVTDATVDASAVRSAGRYCLSPRGVPSEGLAGRGPGHHPAARTVWFGPVCFAASPLLHRSGCVNRGSLQQCLLALPRREGGQGQLRVALCAQVLRVRVIQFLPAVLRGCPREDEELVQVPVALPGGLVVECQPLSHHASRVCGLDGAPQSEAGQVVRRARLHDMGLRIEHP